MRRAGPTREGAELNAPAQPTTAPISPVRREPSRRPTVVAITALLVFYAVMAFSAAAQKGLSFDEGEHIAVGYDMWVRRDFRMETANGDLVKRWATLPLLVTHPEIRTKKDLYWLADSPYHFAYDFFFKQGNDPRGILLQCRAMIVLLGLATCLLVYACARELFGVVGGLLALAVFVSSPNMLAFGGIVSTEMTTFLCLTGSAWCAWKLSHRVTPLRLLASVGFASLMVLAKPTAIILLPLALVIVTARFASRRPVVWQIWVERAYTGRAAQAAIFAGLLALHVVCGWVTIWAAYDFRFAASPQAADTQIASPPDIAVATPIGAGVEWAEHHRLLPEGYCQGLQLVLSENGTEASFMNGRWSEGGWRSFFPYAMWAKTQPAFFALFALGLASWLVAAMRGGPEAGKGPPREALYAATPFFALVLVYSVIAITWHLDIGLRHILPIYVPGYILTGALVFFWRRRGLLAGAVIALLLAAKFAAAVYISPDFLAYFSPFVGGPAKGYQHLVDSSLDWGQDLPRLKQWLTQHNPGDREPFYFSYFGVGNPDYYHIKSHRLPGRPDWRSEGVSYPLGPGIYAISATLLQGIGMPTVGPWNKEFEQAYWQTFGAVSRWDRAAGHPDAVAALFAEHPMSYWQQQYSLFEMLRFGRLCAWLRHRPPDDNVGYSILIWHLTQDDVYAFGLGPPVELADKPLLAPR